MNSHHLSPRARLEGYLHGLRRRIRTLIYARAAAVFAVGALLVTAVAVWALNRSGFPSHFAAIGRLSLLALAVLVGITLLWRPLRRLRFKEGADEFEHRLPAQRGRIETYLDIRRRQGQGHGSPLVDLLAGDAVALADATPVRDVIPAPRIWSGAAVALGAALVLLLLLIAGPAYWGYGSRYLLMGVALPRTAVPLRQIAVSPGDTTVRRNSDLAIRASVEGFTPEQAQVLVRFDDEQRWQAAPMQAIRNGESTLWEFKLYALRGPLHYYVTARNARAGERSAQYSVAVVDLPRIKGMRLTYVWPQWTGLPAQTEETSRNIRAVAGTTVKLEVIADAPLDSPAVVIDGNTAAMNEEGATNIGSIAVKNAGNYHISARVAGELVALTDDYSIEIIPDEKPSIDIQKPGRDWRATSIEEVPVRVQAQDDFRLQQVELRYAVNGGEWQTRQLGGGKRQETAESLLRLEELGAKRKIPGENRSQPLMPGDLVSYYAVAKDRKDAAQTDLFMVQVQPFERRFTQGQGGGGGSGSGMGGEQGAISERQREILLATWNLQRRGDRNSRSRAQLQDSAKMLAELQTTLAVQTSTFAERMRARVSDEEDAGVTQFIESLEAAAKAMGPAANHLSELDFKAAVSVEQQALQQLLRAEAALRDFQVMMQSDRSGSGGEQASRNFTEMFELEMDVDKNHYETESQLSQNNEQHDLDEAIRKLKELAERQEKLAKQVEREEMSQREQRWQQEQLRREAEDLRRQLAEVSRSNNAPADSGDGPSSSERSSEQGRHSSTALNSMRQALEDMRAANDAQSQGDAANRAARDAGRNLRQALDHMKQPAGAAMDDRLEQLAGRTQQLAGQQREAEADLYSALSKAMDSPQQRGEIDQRSAQTLVEKKLEMAAQLSAVQREMRDVLNDQRSKHPQATQRLADALSELENENLSHRLNRSAAEIRYGRAREAAPREGLIAEGLDALEHNLRATARIAATEGQKRDAGQASPEALLAELSELRRALQKGQRGNDAMQAQSRAAQAAQSPSASPAASPPASNGRTGRNQSSEGKDADRSDSAEPGNGLNAWNPSAWRSSPNLSSASLETGAGQFRREAEEVSERVRELTNRMKAGELSAAQIDSLRRMGHELRRLAGNPLASQADAMSKLVDQIELVTLAATENSRKMAAHTSAATQDAPEYREAVAEYYRRLGGN